MTRLRLVRHARPTENWDAAPDAGLDATGHAQARAVADALASDRPCAVLTSPLRRARETAAPLADRWGTDAEIVDSVGEIAAPHVAADERSGWLREVLAGTWRDVDRALGAWRTQLLEALRSIEHDAVVFTHFVAINTAVGAATDDPRVMCCAPAHASITEMTVDGGVLRLVSIGAEADMSMPRAGDVS